MATKHKCFISYHVDDRNSVQSFLDEFDDVFIAKELGVTDDDDFIDSDDEDYVLRRIRELYLTDSTVTIVLWGKCTKVRKYVDWEIKSSLRDDPNNKRSGLLGINLKSFGTANKASDRFNDNYQADGSLYAEYIAYPKSKATLRNAIQAAYDKRTTKEPDNKRGLRQRNGSCE